MRMDATDSKGRGHVIFLPTPNLMLEYIQRQQRLEAAAQRALDHIIGLPGEDATEIAEELREALGRV
jgi:hypothetical protein